MARTGFATTSNLRVTHQSAKFWKYAQPKTFWARRFRGKLMDVEQADGKGLIVASDDNALIQTVMDLEKKRGDKITYPMIAPLTSAGTTGDNDLEGNEEALSLYDYSLELFQIAHAVRGMGRLSERRTQFEIKGKAMPALNDWAARKLDYYTTCALSGVASSDGNVAESAPTTNRYFVGGQTTAGVLSEVANLAALTDTTNYLFGASVIDEVLYMASSGSQILRPIVIDGEDWYVMVIDPLQAKALWKDANWINAQLHANTKGASNPYFKGALGTWKNVILHQYGRLERRLGHAGTDASEYFTTGQSANPLPSGIMSARALLCGAGAAVQAFGDLPRPLTEQFDYGRKWGLGLDMMLDVSKPVFNSEDYGVVAVDTVVVP
jgi:N4-gp56 family major capsid protein